MGGAAAAEAEGEPATGETPTSGGDMAARTSTAPVVRRDRWRSWRAAAAQSPPSAREVAVATLLGGVLLAVSNAVAIAVVLGVPADGWWLRLGHHAFDALEVLGLAAWLAIGPALAARVKRLPSWVGYLLMAVLCSAAMRALLIIHLRRQSYAVLDGVLSWGLLPLYIVLCGVAVPAAFVLGGFFARLRWWAALPAIASLGAVVINHLILRDDYPGVHTVVAWVAASLGGAVLAPAACRWLEGRRRWQVVTGAGAVLGIAAVAWSPPNAVRFQLFREPGAVAAWVLALTVWQPPKIAVERPAPTVGHYAAGLRRRARRGLSREPVVVMLTVDAMRGDVLQNGEYDALLPNLARLRDSGAYFPHCNSPGSQTSVSFTSVFSGRYFSQLFWSYVGKGRTRFQYAARDQTTRFPELLGRAGVHTHTVVGVIFLSHPFGIARGFDDEQIVVRGRAHATARSVMQPLLSKLKGARRGPHFIFAHLMEPHEPYDRGRLKKGSAWERYLSEIQVVDHWVGALRKLMRRRYRRRGYIILAADHGEAFGEHGTHFHTKTLYQELVHVPLVISGPGIASRRFQQRVGLIDLGPTIMHLFGQPTPPGSMGITLLPLIRGLTDELPRPLFVEGRLRRGMFAAGGLKVIEDSRRKVVEAYDLGTDPGELHNMFDTDRQRVEPALAALRAFFAEHTLRRAGYRPVYKP